MKYINDIKEVLQAKGIEKFYFLLILAMCFLMPQYKISSSPFLILLGGIIIINLIKSKFKILKKLFIKKINIPLVILYLYGLFSMLYTQNIESGLFQIKHTLPLVIFPLLFTFYSPSKKEVIIFLKMFVIGCTSAFLLSVFSQFYNIVTGVEYSFYYQNFIEFIWMHPTYLSMYLNFAILISYFLYTRKEYGLKRLIFNICLFIFFILLLSARMQIISLFIVLSIIFIHILKFKFSKKLIIGVLFLLMSSIFFIKQNEHLSNRFIYIQTLNYNFSQTKNWNGANVRLAIWNSALDVIRENAIFGVGIGDEDEELMKSYQLNHFTFAYNLNYVAHNQFVQVLLSLGIIGLFMYMAIFYLAFKTSINSRDFLLFSLMILLFFTGLTESFLRMQSGIVFFVFMICLLMQNKEKLSNKNT